MVNLFGVKGQMMQKSLLTFQNAFTIWNLALQRDIRLIEKVQKCATKCIKGLSNKSYLERLSILKLDSLQKRRLVCGLVTVYKIIYNFSPLDASKVFQYTCEKSTNTRHKYKLTKKYIHLDCRKYLFSNRIISTWNNLPDNIVLSLSLPEFKRKVCKFIENEDVKWF